MAWATFLRQETVTVSQGKEHGHSVTFPKLDLNQMAWCQTQKTGSRQKSRGENGSFFSFYIMILMKVSKWEVKTSKIGGFNSLHTPALTQVPPQKRQEGMILTVILKGGPSDGSTREGCRQD